MQKKRSIALSVAAALLLPAVLVAALLMPKQHPAGDTVVASMYPVYLIAANLLQGLPYQVDYIEAAEGGCAHDYLLTPNDCLKIERAKAVIRIGAGMDDYLLKAKPAHSDALWVEGAAFIPPEDDLFLSPSAVNPHFFASPRLYWKMSDGIGKAFRAFVKPGEIKRLEENTDAWQLSLLALEKRAAALADELSGTAVLTQHPVFDYLARDLGIRVVGAVQTNDDDALSSAHLLRLLQTIADEGVRVMLSEPHASTRLAALLQQEARLPVLVLDPVAVGGSGRLDDYSVRMNQNFRRLHEWAQAH